jgi:hypothetical protein
MNISQLQIGANPGAVDPLGDISLGPGKRSFRHPLFIFPNL